MRGLLRRTACVGVPLKEGILDFPGRAGIPVAGDGSASKRAAAGGRSGASVRPGPLPGEALWSMVRGDFL